MEYEKYGESHKEAKRLRYEQEGRKQCKVTGQWRDVEYHHATPRFFNGANHPSNYQEVVKFVHQQLHQAANITDPSIVAKRVHLTKLLMRNLTSEEFPQIHQSIREMDKVLVAQYVQNMLDNISHKYRDKIIELTMVSGMDSTRDLSIELERIKAIVSELKELFPEISDHLSQYNL